MKKKGYARTGFNVRSIGFEDVCDTGDQEASDETIVPNILPSLLHVFLARLDAK